MFLPIITYPNKILSQKAAMVEFPLDLKTKELIKNMWQTVEDKGVGLAAPQVNVSKQLCIIRLDSEMANKKDKKLEFVMINPKITFYSEVQKNMIEGCLSFPDQYYEIKRPLNICVEFWTIANFAEIIQNPNKKEILKKQQLKATNWMARVIQHEVDHLNGELFIFKGGQKIESKDLNGREIID
jgi:peptide deformylase